MLLASPAGLCTQAESRPVAASMSKKREEKARGRDMGVTPNISTIHIPILQIYGTVRSSDMQKKHI